MARKGMAWLIEEFKGVSLGDKRLNRRCGETVKALGRRPDKSIPQACEDWGSAKGVYRFLSNEKVTRDALLAPHMAKTAKRCEGRAEAVVAHDTTYVNLTGHEAMEGLGPIGRKELRGFVVQNAVAVDGETGEVLGLAHQEAWVRKGYRRDETENCFQRRKRPRESERWTRGIAAVRELGLKDVIHVADRESDVYEVLELLDRENARYVIRGCWNRRLAEEEVGLMDAVKQSPVEGTLDVELSARPRRAGVVKHRVSEGRAARTARLSLRRARVAIQPPKTLSMKERTVEISVVRASEDNAPEGVEPIEWILLTGEPTETPEALKRVVRLYSRRWRIEEFHMGIKTGCALEDRQFKTMERMDAFLGLASVIGIMLLRLRDGARGESSAGSYLTEVQLKCLRSKHPEIGTRPTAREALRAVARLGGFLARKGDGEPGWRTIWRGMEQLLFIEHGYHTALNQFRSLIGSPICG